MTKLAFPSEEFPAWPAIALQIPDGWVPVHRPGAVVAARRARDTGTFVPNVVVRIEPRPAGFEVTDALTELREYVAQRPQGTIAESAGAQVEGRQVVGCDLSWVDEQAGTVLQAHLFAGVAAGRFTQLVQVTGSVGGAQATEDYPTVKAIMASLTIGESEPGAGQG